MNNKSTSSWKISFDPNLLMDMDSWNNLDCREEDLIQIENNDFNIVIDLGCYSGVYKLLLVFDYDWESAICLKRGSELTDEFKRIIASFLKGVSSSVSIGNYKDVLFRIFNRDTINPELQKVEIFIANHLVTRVDNLAYTPQFCQSLRTEIETLNSFDNGILFNLGPTTDEFVVNFTRKLGTVSLSLKCKQTKRKNVITSEYWLKNIFLATILLIEATPKTYTIQKQ